MTTSCDDQNFLQLSPNVKKKEDCFRLIETVKLNYNLPPKVPADF